MKYIIALDQGTSSSRALVIDQYGKIIAMSQAEFTQFFPKPGHVEHDPEEIFTSQFGTLEAVISKANVRPDDVVALGITNQRETVVAWNRKTGKPIHKAIVWQDRRTSSYCNELKSAGHFENIRERTGLPIDPYFSATKIKWLLDNVDGARTMADRGDLLVGTIDTWLMWKLTKGQVHATDYTNASRTMLFNIKTLRWDDELLELFDIPQSILPEFKKSSHAYGTLEYRGIQIPIAGVAGDQQAALFGQGCLKKGDTKNTYGTGCFLLMNNGSDFSLSKNGLITTLACSLSEQPTYAFEGSIFIAGAAIQWLRDGLKIIDSASETALLARQADDDELVMVPAFVGLGTPYWDSAARGAIFGLNRDSGRAHFARAALQSIAFQTRDVIEAMVKDGGLKPENLKVDGGATANDYLMQFQADILNIAIHCSANQDKTALGAAYLAGIQVGLWSLQDVANFAAEGKVFASQMNADQRASLYKNWQKAIKRTLGWLKD